MENKLLGQTSGHLLEMEPPPEEEMDCGLLMLQVRDAPNVAEAVPDSAFRPPPDRDAPPEADSFATLHFPAADKDAPEEEPASTLPAKMPVIEAEAPDDERNTTFSALTSPAENDAPEEATADTVAPGARS